MTNNLLIKVCGMRRPDNIRAVAELPIDMMGFIFCPASKRHVDGMTPSLAGLLPDNADTDFGNFYGARTKGHIDRVGVFVDDTAQNIITRIVNFRLDAIQLHGSESPTYIRNLRATVIPDIRPQLKVLKAVSIASADDFDACRQYEGIVDMFVFDTKCDSHGGSGKQFDWNALNAYTGSIPFLLSGGISPADAGRIRLLRHPQLAGIDINSRFETAPGVKDAELVSRFIGQLQ